MILETAIVIRDWPIILDYWPQLKVSETLFPPHLKYFDLELKNDVRLLVYFADSVLKEDFGVSDLIIPYVPFSLLFISALDATHEKLWQEYEHRYRTPLFFLAPDEQTLRDQIVLHENLASKLSSVIFFSPDDPLTLSWTLISKQCVENVQFEKSNKVE